MAVAFRLLATGFELCAHPHQPGLRLAVLERFFALLEIDAETSQGKAFQDAIQEIVDVQVGMLVGCLLVGGAADNRKTKCVGARKEKVGGSVSNDSSTSTIGSFTLDDRARH